MKGYQDLEIWQKAMDYEEASRKDSYKNPEP